MKKLLFTLTILAFCISAYAQTPEEMKAWQANMTPGEHHKWLASFDGDWNTLVKMWMDPSQPAQQSKGKTTNEMIMNGLYQRSSHQGEMMGMPFNGESITGYDNAKKKFVGTWIDNFGSGIMYMEGHYDKAKDALITKGTMLDPASGKDIKIRQVLTRVSEDIHTFEMFMDMNGQEVKSMEITYTRE